MTFATDARRVRDHGLPYSHRRTALRCAVGRHMPLGFTATWRYITGAAGPVMYRRDEALLRALDILETSRAARLREMEAFAARRRSEKQRGYGVRHDEQRYRFGFRWYGPDSHEAMYQTVETLWAEHKAQPFPGGSHALITDALMADTYTAGCVHSYLHSGGRLTGGTRAILRRCVADLHRGPFGGPESFQYFRRLAKMADLVLHDALPLIRRGWVGDAAAVRDVFLSATAGKPYLREAEPDAGSPGWIEGFLACGSSHELWVAELRGRIVAFATLSIDQLGHLFVTPGLQRQGIGTDLIVHAKRVRPGGLRLHAFQRDTDACRFYERHGFTVSGLDDESGEPELTYSWQQSGGGCGSRMDQ
ncbi:GNAT family N-acetyltransferase [Acrocarpospora catenulata]|uniref:GNAT family N-acetyltransferase n=1 Tax=Acrocarpospora catenulata TaxID=2836182 RepID=UPI001BDAE656|nr:GNAT family N-acetyltransferase [Acrocarpospora catenulata]